MKRFSDLIDEALDAEQKKWIENVYNTQIELEKDGEISQIEVDVNKLNKPKNPFTYDQWFDDKTLGKMIDNDKTGFTVTNQLVKMKNKYLVVNDKEIKPSMYPYWYKNGNNIYFIGLCLFDHNISLIESYITLIAIETSLIVENSEDLLKAILADFSNFASDKGNFKGIAYKESHPKMSSTLLKIGFNKSNDNDEIYIMKI